MADSDFVFSGARILDVPDEDGKRVNVVLWEMTRTLTLSVSYKSANLTADQARALADRIYLLARALEERNAE